MVYLHSVGFGSRTKKVNLYGVDTKRAIATYAYANVWLFSLWKNVRSLFPHQALILHKGDFFVLLCAQRSSRKNLQVIEHSDLHRFLNIDEEVQSTTGEIASDKEIKETWKTVKSTCEDNSSADTLPKTSFISYIGETKSMSNALFDIPSFSQCTTTINSMTSPVVDIFNFMKLCYFKVVQSASNERP